MRAHIPLRDRAGSDTLHAIDGECRLGPLRARSQARLYRLEQNRFRSKGNVQPDGTVRGHEYVKCA